MSAASVSARSLQAAKLEKINTQQSGSGYSFIAEGANIDEMQIRVFNLAGKQLYNSGWASGSTLHWRAMDANNKPLTNGVYLYVVAVRGPDGAVFEEVRKLIILR